MQYILSLLPLLACPLGMGLMMWLMMRGNKQDQAPQRTDQVPMNTYNQHLEVAESPKVTQASPQRTSIFKMLFMCFNLKVVAGLAVGALIVLVLAPQYIWAALPLLLVAACPLSMLFIMRGMQGKGSKTISQPVQVSQPLAIDSTHDEQLAELQSRLSSIQAEQEAIARQLAELESPKAVVISEAESVARA